MNFSFDEASHIYRLESIRLPSVTEILEYWGITPQFPIGPYRVRGRQVHLATQAWDEGAEIVRLGSEIAPYLESYKLAMADWDFEWSGIEVRGYHQTLAYAGTADRVGIRRGSGKPCLADIKSGDTTEKETGMQTAAYVMMIQNCEEIINFLPVFCKPEQVERYRIRLYKDGRKGDVVQYKKPGAFAAFAGLVQAYKFLTS